MGCCVVVDTISHFGLLWRRVFLYRTNCLVWQRKLQTQQQSWLSRPNTWQRRQISIPITNKESLCPPPTRDCAPVNSLLAPRLVQLFASPLPTVKPFDWLIGLGSVVCRSLLPPSSRRIVSSNSQSPPVRFHRLWTASSGQPELQVNRQMSRQAFRTTRFRRLRRPFVKWTTLLRRFETR